MKKQVRRGIDGRTKFTIVKAANISRFTRQELINTFVEIDKICKGARGHAIEFEKATGEVGALAHNILCRAGLEPEKFSGVKKTKE